jgi:F-type H+-transporting ATPase subunit epsilon
MAETVSTNTIQAVIVTPDGTEFDNSKVSLAVLTTTNGELGIMTNRLPVVASLKIDSAKFQIGNDTENFAINGGFAEFSNNVLTIVAPSAENAKTIDITRAEQAKTRAEKKANSAKNADERKRAQVALARAINRINTSKLH